MRTAMRHATRAKWPSGQAAALFMHRAPMISNDEATTASIRSHDHWIDVGQGRLFARRWEPPEAQGSAEPLPPIILFHDSLGCVTLWGRFPEALARGTGLPVIAYDRAGFGQSDPREDQLGATFVHDEAETYFPRLCEHFGIDRFIVMGHSVGGGMAIECAARFPERCVALITESAQTFPEERTLDGIRAARTQFKDPAQFARLERYHGDKSQWVLEAWTETWLSSEFANWTLKDVLPRVQCATLAIHGSEDEYGTRIHPEAIASEVSGSGHAVILDGIHHVPHRECEQVVVDTIRAFVEPLVVTLVTQAAQSDKTSPAI